MTKPNPKNPASPLKPIRDGEAPALLIALAMKTGEIFSCFLDETKEWFESTVVSVDFLGPSGGKICLALTKDTDLSKESLELIEEGGCKVKLRFPGNENAIFALGYVEQFNPPNLGLRLETPFFEVHRRKDPRVRPDSSMPATINFVGHKLSIHDISMGGLSVLATKAELDILLRQNKVQSCAVSLGRVIIAAVVERMNYTQIQNNAMQFKVGFQFRKLPGAIEIEIRQMVRKHSDELARKLKKAA